MKINAYKIIEDACIVEETSEDFIEPWQKGKGLYFVDVLECSADELGNWLKELNVSDLAINLCVHQRKSSVVVPLTDEIFFEVPVCGLRAEGDTDTEEEKDIEAIDHYISVLCLKDLVITMYADPIADADPIVEVLKSQLKLTSASTPALLSILLARESLKVNQMVGQLRSSAFKLDERMDKDPDSVEADEIRDLKSQLRVYDTLANGQLTCFQQLRALETPFFSFTGLSTYFELASANALAASQATLRLEKTIYDLSQRYNTNQQEKTNHRLAVLTILSAIFMPLTFIAGIYGMNFENMPELQFAWSYPLVIICMLLIALGMFLYFKIRGWLE